jgi:hypothetical protein
MRNHIYWVARVTGTPKDKDKVIDEKIGNQEELKD